MTCQKTTLLSPGTQRERERNALESSEEFLLFG